MTLPLSAIILLLTKRLSFDEIAQEARVMFRQVCNGYDGKEIDGESEARIRGLYEETK